MSVIKAVLKKLYIDRAAKLILERSFLYGMRTFLRHPMARETAPIDLTVMAQVIASMKSAQYLIERMNDVPNFYTQLGLLEHALKSAQVTGMNLEFGVYTGETIRFISNFVDKVYGFDTFTGIDKPWRYDIDMKFFDLTGTDLPAFPANVELVVGLFEETLPQWAEKMTQICRFIHIDSDIYESSATVFRYLEDKIVPGTIIVFDEYWNYPGWEKHEHRAFMEFVERKRCSFEYIGFASGHLSVAAKIT